MMVAEIGQAHVTKPAEGAFSAAKFILWTGTSKAGTAHTTTFLFLSFRLFPLLFLLYTFCCLY